ncbi:MAG: hypothetical protein QNK05_06380 [Myxococcota bacterium]|nr:hypothetical protein [Myxococcota bacterium]
MSEERSQWQADLDTLRGIRDEIRVQAELGKAELRDEFQKLEKRWHELEGKIKVIAEEARDDLDDVRAAADVLVDEIKDGYRHLKARF